MNRAIEEILYPALEDFRLDIVVGQGAGARTLTLDLPPFTLVGATTRTGLLTTPLRDRFGMTFRLGYYEQDELATIVRRSAGILGVEIADEAADEVARRARGTPRVANRILRRIRDVAEVRHAGAVTIDGRARGARAARGRRRRARARRPRAPRGRSRTSSAAARSGSRRSRSSLGEEPDTIEDVYEPYLLQLGFLQRTPRGRVITELGREHLGVERATERALLGMSAQIWTPGAAGPLDEFVSRLTRMVEAFASEHELEQAEVRIELADGSRYTLASDERRAGLRVLLVRHRTARRATSHEADRPDRRGDARSRSPRPTPSARSASWRATSRHVPDAESGSSTLSLGTGARSTRERERARAASGRPAAPRSRSRPCRRSTRRRGGPP